MTDWRVMKNTKESLQGPLGKGLRNILGYLLPYMAIPTSHHYSRVDNCSIVGRESHNITRIIKVAMYIIGQ